MRSFPAQFWSRLSLQERLALIFVPAAIVAGGGDRPGDRLLGPPFLDFLGANLPLVRFVVAATAILMLTMPTAFVLIYLELKVIARMNLRVGPNRVGPWGIGDERHPRLQGPLQGGLRPDRRRHHRLHPGSGRDLHGQRHDPPGHPVRARA
jgi:hypothetical protein